MPIEPPYKGRITSKRRFVTGATSAECGLEVEMGRAHLIFAARDDVDSSVLRFDTCNGSRVLGAQSPAGATGFLDVPREKVLARLNVLRAHQAITAPEQTSGGPRLPAPGDAHAELIGLIELPSVLSTGDSAAPPPAAAVVVRSQPRAEAAIVAEIRSRRDLITREHSYEARSAVVRERRGGWFRVAIDDRKSGWIDGRDGGPFHPIPDLLINRLCYLNDHWDGWVWPEPGAGYPIDVGKHPEGRSEFPVRVIGTQDLAGTLWLQVELLTHSPCEGDEPKVQAGGWVPAYTPEGKLTAWFYSRGC